MIKLQLIVCWCRNLIKQGLTRIRLSTLIENHIVTLTKAFVHLNHPELSRSGNSTGTRDVTFHL